MAIKYFFLCVQRWLKTFYEAYKENGKGILGDGRVKLWLC